MCVCLGGFYICLRGFLVGCFGGFFGCGFFWWFFVGLIFFVCLFACFCR